jgi:hypothetical protein
VDLHYRPLPVNPRGEEQAAPMTGLQVQQTQPVICLQSEISKPVVQDLGHASTHQRLFEHLQVEGAKRRSRPEKTFDHARAGIRGAGASAQRFERIVRLLDLKSRSAA